MVLVGKGFFYYFVRYIILLFFPWGCIAAYFVIHYGKFFVDGGPSEFSFNHQREAAVLLLVFMPILFSCTVSSCAMYKYRMWEWHIPRIQSILLWPGYSLLAFLMIPVILDIMGVVANFLAGSLSINGYEHGIRTTINFFGIVLVYAFSFTMFLSLADYLSLRSGLLTVYNRAHYKRQGAFISLLSYALYCIGTLGLLKGISIFSYFFIIDSLSGNHGYLYWIGDNVATNDIGITAYFLAISLDGLIVIWPSYFLTRYGGRLKQARDKQRNDKK